MSKDLFENHPLYCEKNFSIFEAVSRKKIIARNAESGQYCALNVSTSISKITLREALVTSAMVSVSYFGFVELDILILAKKFFVFHFLTD